jgi:hypothetical protein
MHVENAAVWVGIEVVGADGRCVGWVKATYDLAVLVDRPGARDVYVPWFGIDAVRDNRLVLPIPAGRVDDMDWPSPVVAGEPGSSVAHRADGDDSRDGAREHHVGIFRTRAEAERAFDALLAAGFTTDQLSLITGQAPADPDWVGKVSEFEVRHLDAGARAGAETGAVIGSAGALLAGAGLLAVPGIGPLLAIGPIAAALVGAAGGAAAGGIVGALVAMGVQADEARTNAAAVESGHSLVIVWCDGCCEQALATIQSAGAIEA